MLTQLFKKKKEFVLERTYPSSIDAVWRAWTDADALRQWWGPDKTTVPECSLELRPGGALRIVTEAGEGMGKYAGTRWPMEGAITVLDAPHRLVYEARSWTEGDEGGSTIHHVNDLTLRPAADGTALRLHVTITRVGPKAKMASFGMKMGYKAQLDKLAAHVDGAG